MPEGARLAGEGERADEGLAVAPASGPAVAQGRLGAEAVEVEMPISEDMQISEEVQTS